MMKSLGIVVQWAKLLPVMSASHIGNEDPVCILATLLHFQLPAIMPGKPAKLIPVSVTISRVNV